jgi:hypothetical protein
MDQKSSLPLMQNHLPLILLGSLITLYGLLTALVGGWLSNQAMTGAITAGNYRSSLAAFDRTAGLLAGILFLALFIFGAVKSKGIVRVALAIGAVAAVSPVLAARAENILFNVIGLPTMSAGSVLAGAVTTLFFALPLTIAFILLASGKRVPKGCRWLSFASIFIVLGTSLYPIFVTVMAFLIKPGDPAVGQMMEVSSTVIKLRYLLLGLCFLFLAFFSMRFARKQQAAVSSTVDINPLAQA